MARNLDKEEKKKKKKNEIKIETFQADCLAIELRKGNIRRGILVIICLSENSTFINICSIDEGR